MRLLDRGTAGLIDGGAVLPGRRLTPFRDEQLRRGALRDLSVDGRRYCLLDAGRGPALVLIHGIGGSLYDWRHLVAPLAAGYRVIAIDLLGAGESDCPAREDYSIAAQARRVRSVLDRLDIRSATFVGNSYGGGIALRFAQDWPERVERLVLINSVCYADRIPAYVPLASFPFAGWIAEALPLGKTVRRAIHACHRTVRILSDEELETYARELRAPGRRRALVEVLRAIVPSDRCEFEARLRRMQTPALLIWGAADRTIPVELGRRLAKELPRAQLVELAAGHVPNQERPEEVLRLLRTFLP
jgi:pimeloyl-ACP methyl ester carboxylesterase